MTTTENAQLNDGGPAFPYNPKKWDSNGFFVSDSSEDGHGMSLRDWFAGMALQGVISGSAHPMFSYDGGNVGLVEESIQTALENGTGKLGRDSNSIRTIWAWTAYCVADAMIAERNRKEGIQ